MLFVINLIIWVPLISFATYKAIAWKLEEIKYSRVLALAIAERNLEPYASFYPDAPVPPIEENQALKMNLRAHARLEEVIMRACSEAAAA